MGFKPMPTFVDQNTPLNLMEDLNSWVWRLRPLGHPDYNGLMNCKIREVGIIPWPRKSDKRCLEDPGIDPGTSRMLSERSTIWASPPCYIRLYLILFRPMTWPIAFSKNVLPGGESNPGLPRDRRGYSPLYYRGWSLFVSLLLEFVRFLEKKNLLYSLRRLAHARRSDWLGRRQNCYNLFKILSTFKRYHRNFLKPLGSKDIYCQSWNNILMTDAR